MEGGRSGGEEEREVASYLQTIPQTMYLDVSFVQFKCLTSVCQGIPVALCLEVCKAAIAIIHCHRGVEINCLGVEVDGLVKLVICISEGDANIQHCHNTCGLYQ